MADLTDEQLDELERLETQMTPGPFIADANIYGTGTQIYGPPRGQILIADVTEVYRRVSHDQSMADAMGLVHARNALPSLIAEIRRLRQENQELKLWVAR